MNKDILAGKWKQLKGEIKEKWTKLTDDDLGKVDGNHDKFLGAIQERYGIAKEKAEKEVSAFLDAHGEQDEKICTDLPKR